MSTTLTERKPGQLTAGPVVQSTPARLSAPSDKSVSPPTLPWYTLAQFLGGVYDHGLAEDANKLALFEPRRVMTPEGYHSTKCVAAGLYALLTQADLAAVDGGPLPTEVTGCTFSYRVLAHQVPVFFVDGEFARAVAATQLPDDFTFGDLYWPQNGMVIGWPPKFLHEYTQRELCYVFAANCPAGSYAPPHQSRAPVIEVPAGRSKIGWFYYAWSGGRPECFVSAYLTKDKLAESISGYSYTDYMQEAPDKVQADREFTERISALMLKLLVIINVQPSFVTHGAQDRTTCRKHRHAAQQPTWGPNFIGRGYRLARPSAGTHASPRLHIRRGHVAWQAIGPRSSGEFVSASTLPRNVGGAVDWDQVAPELRTAFLRCHKRLWLQPILVSGSE